jgi:hypothetical protein
LAASGGFVCAVAVESGASAGSLRRLALGSLGGDDSVDLLSIAVACCPGFGCLLMSGLRTSDGNNGLAVIAVLGPVPVDDTTVLPEAGVGCTAIGATLLFMGYVGRGLPAIPESAVDLFREGLRTGSDDFGNQVQPVCVQLRQIVATRIAQSTQNFIAQNSTCKAHKFMYM